MTFVTVEASYPKETLVLVLNAAHIIRAERIKDGDSGHGYSVMILGEEQGIPVY